MSTTPVVRIGVGVLLVLALVAVFAGDLSGWIVWPATVGGLSVGLALVVGCGGIRMGSDCPEMVGQVTADAPAITPNTRPLDRAAPTRPRPRS